MSREIQFTEFRTKDHPPIEYQLRLLYCLRDDMRDACTDEHEKIFDLHHAEFIKRYNKETMKEFFCYIFLVDKQNQFTKYSKKVSAPIVPRKSDMIAIDGFDKFMFKIATIVIMFDKPVQVFLEQLKDLSDDDVMNYSIILQEDGWKKVVE